MRDFLARFLPGILLLGLLSVPASATEVVVFDGTWWRGLSDGDKVVAVQGMLAGYPSGYWRGLNEAISVVLGKAKSMTPSQLYAISKMIASLDPPPMNATFGTVMDRLNDLYVEHPEVMKDATAYYVACAASDTGDCSKAIRAVHP